MTTPGDIQEYSLNAGCPLQDTIQSCEEVLTCSRVNGTWMCSKALHTLTVTFSCYGKN